MTTPVFPSFTPLKWEGCKGVSIALVCSYDVLIHVFVC